MASELQVELLSPDPSAGARVLVVDDSRQNREFLSDYVLTPNGYQPILAFDGADGLHKVISERPDIVLLDLEMPRMTGVEVLQALRERKIEVPVILMTGHGSEQVAIEVFRLGVRDYVIKPFKLDEILMILKRALVEAQLRRERDELLKRLTQANQQLERRVQELNTLYGIGKSVTTLMDREKLLNRITNAAVLITGGDEGNLALVDLMTGQFTHQAVRALGEAIDPVPPELEKVTQLVIKTSQVVATKTTLHVPLILANRTMGAIGVRNTKTNRPFTKHDSQLLQMLADYAAIALENVRLFHELEIQKEKEKQDIRRTFERYVAPTVTERIMANPQEITLGGVSQTITVLFADIRGFTAITHNFAPEVLVDLLNKHIAAAAKAILKEEGTLDKFMGDAIIAFFNAPLPQADYVLRAVRTAIAMQQAINLLHQSLPPEHRFHFGIGLSTGAAVVGNIGTAQQMNYTAIGDSVNLAQRLQAKAEKGQILLCQQTFAAIQDIARVKPLGPVELKGFSQPQPVFKLLGLK